MGSINGETGIEKVIERAFSFIEKLTKINRKKKTKKIRRANWREAAGQWLVGTVRKIDNYPRRPAAGVRRSPPRTHGPTQRRKI